MDPISTIALVVVGLAFGSFLNVCISRIPRELSIIAPRSHCPACRTPIVWHDNIPLLSWIVLRGRCRACGRTISLRYPLVELLTGVLFVACYASFGLNWLTLKSCVFCFLVVGLIFMDAETGLLPAKFTYPGMAAGLLFAWLIPVDSSGTAFLMSVLDWRVRASTAPLSLVDAIAAAIFGAGFFFLAWAAYYLVRKRDGVGFGDIAFMAMAATFLGLKLTVLVVVLSPILGTIYAFGSLAVRPGNAAGVGQERWSGGSLPGPFLLRAIPFGVFLGAAALIALFAGESIWSWYLGFFR